MIKLGIITLFGSLLFTQNIFASNPVVRIATNYGNIDIELYADKAPITVQNFLDYVDNRHYTGTIFHRVIDNFMIQGGGFDKNYKQRPTRNPVPNESTNRLSNLNGTISMARTGDPHSATAQFFINVRDNTFLDFAMTPAKGINTLRQGQPGILDLATGRVTTVDCHGNNIQQDTLQKAAQVSHDDKNGYICLMQAILQKKDYSQDMAMSECMNKPGQEHKTRPDVTCPDRINQRYKDLQLAYVRWGYTVFGKVTHGMEAVNQIKSTSTGAAGRFPKDVPLEPVIIQSIQRMEN